MNNNINSQKKKEKKEYADGVVVEALPSASFRVKLQDNSEVLAHLSGKIRRFRIRVLPGDKVTVEISRYDKKRGRIVYRKK